MNEHKLESARETWLTEIEFYQNYCNAVKDELNEAFRKKSLSVSLSNRIKEDHSLLKKMWTKGYEYDDIKDKAGVRAIVPFQSDLKLADEIIRETFGERIVNIDNKMDTTDEKTFGYLSIHYDIIDRIESDDPMFCELQLRTVCQNAWSELSHILAYKPEVELPINVKREVNALSALMEVEDSQFQKIYDLIDKLPVSNPTRILRRLSGFFYTNIAAWYDTEMSHYFLKDVHLLYDKHEDIIQILTDYIQANSADISSKAKQWNKILFFSQPEIVVILERLDHKPFKLEQYWQSKYPIEELRAIANAWGKSLD